jgi:hypothetical protein
MSIPDSRLDSVPIAPAERARKRAPAVFIAITVLVLLSPIVENWKSKPVDSFPLSYYPMFSHRRESTFRGESIVGIGADGSRHVLPYRVVGTGGFNQVRRQVRAQVKAGRGEDLCASVAARLSRSKDAALREVHTVEVRRATHDVNAFFAGDRTPLKSKVYAACAVPGRQQNETTQSARLQEVQR